VLHQPLDCPDTFQLYLYTLIQHWYANMVSQKVKIVAFYRSRQWLRSMLQSGGGSFLDVFRIIHPDRKEAYTCWFQASGAEEFNYGTRIDLIIAAGNCDHQALAGSGGEIEGTHSFAECEVEDCDILGQFKRFKADSLPRHVIHILLSSCVNPLKDQGCLYEKYLSICMKPPRSIETMFYFVHEIESISSTTICGLVIRYMRYVFKSGSFIQAQTSL